MRARLVGAMLAGVVLLSASAVGAQDASVRGQVLDAVTGAPLASVSVTAGGVEVATNSSGRFALQHLHAEAFLTFERLGYEMQTVSASPGADITIQLDPLPLLLSEVAVQTERGELLAPGTALAVGRVERSEIQASAGTSLAESLDGLEGVSMSFTGSWGSRVALRGLTGERLAILVDGNRVSRACTFGMDQGLATVDPATVERVEVLTGPGSALYGSGNLGGVINVVTRRAPRDGGYGGEVRMSGSSGVPGGGLGVSLGAQMGSLLLDGNIDGASFADYRSPTGTVDGSSYRQLTADLRADWEVSQRQLLSVKGQYYAGRDIGWPMRGGAEIPEETRRSISADWGLQRGGVVDAISGRAFFQRLDHHMVMSMVMQGMGGMPMTSLTDAVSFSETAGGRGQLRLIPLAGIQADVGVEVTHLHAEGTRWTERQMGMNPPTEISFRTWPGVRIMDVGAFAQTEWQASDRLTLSAGFRLDRVRRDADQGDRLVEWIPTGNAGLQLDLTGGLFLRGSVGAGYRTPDPLELYGLALRPDGFVYRGSADLQTERSVNVEATLGLDRSSFAASATVFRNALSDLVVPVLSGDSIAGRPVREYEGLGESTMSGVSGSASVAAGWGLTLTGDATFTRGENALTGGALPLVPPLEGGLTLRKDVDATLRWVEVEWSGAATQNRVATNAGEVSTPAWSVLNLRGSMGLAGTNVIVGVENIMDETYRAHLDPMTVLRPGRNFFIRLSRAF